MSLQRARQEAEPLPGLDGGPGQDDAADFLLLQGLDGLGHGQVGLAGAGRADPEDHRVGVDRVHIVLLVQRLGPDGLAAGGEDVGGQHIHRVLQRLAAEQGHKLLQHRRGDHGAAGHQAAHLMEQPHDPGDIGGGPLMESSLPRTWKLTAGNCSSMNRNGLVMAAERLDHLIGVVEEDHLRPRYLVG